MLETGGFFLEFEPGANLDEALRIAREKTMYVEDWDPGIDENTVGVSDESEVEYDDFEDALERIAVAVAKVQPAIAFVGEAYYTDHNTGETAFDRVSYKDGVMVVENRFAETEGICPECSEKAFDLADFLPDKLVRCAECGFPHEAHEVYRILPYYDRKELTLS